MEKAYASDLDHEGQVPLVLFGGIVGHVLQAERIGGNPVMPDPFAGARIQLELTNATLDLRKAFLLSQAFDSPLVGDESASRLVPQELDHQLRVEVVAVRMGDQEEIHIGEGATTC